MPDITDSVGDGGTNRVHDIAMVQAMLRVVKDAKNSPYLAVDYDGVYGNHTKTGITNFQNDHKLIPPDAKLAKETLGQAIASGPTIQKLSAMLPATHQALRVIENMKTVYLESPALDVAKSKNAITTDPEFEPAFRTKVADLVQQMFDTHKIVIWLTPTGRRRTFAQQAAETQTNAGPGESNHNFGRAADIGFKGFKWIKGDGTIKADADWLNALEAAKAAQANAFWDARDRVAINKIGLFRLQFERVHLQLFDDATVSSQRSLAKLLSTVGKMQWKPAYQCDLGTGGALWFPVGTAKQIWALNSMVTADNIAKAKSLLTKAVVKATTITVKDIADTKKALKADFETADANWIKWQAVP